ncbi:MAG: hypothetical protein SF182_13340 [Deltaproteobacteria bacterium]|nr:hypothetical protein [Deltaproteobacteria bacterium]
MPSARDRLAALKLPGTIQFGAVPREPVRRLPTGIAALDDLLGGGFPRGHLSEIVGRPCSGRTSVLHALLAAATRAGEVAALVDLADALDPASLAAAGAVLERVLWVRPPSARLALQCAELILAGGGFAIVALDLDAPPHDEPRARPRISRAAWPRLAHAARRAGAATILLAPYRLAGGDAALALTLTRRHATWDAGLFEGLTTAVELTRNRFGPQQRRALLQLGEQLTALKGVVVRRLAIQR